jgi:hypothetical protein
MIDVTPPLKIRRLWSRFNVTFTWNGVIATLPPPIKVLP